jgi:NAD(P)H-hydrate repair Nnr-like enzyme with NAD(P)H-hydrate epimerase domain
VQRAGHAVAQLCLAHFKFWSVCVVCGTDDHSSYGMAAAQVLSTKERRPITQVDLRDKL